MVATESFSPKAFDYWMAVEDHPWVIGDFVWTAWDYIGESAIGWFNWPQSQNYFPWHLAYTGDIDVCGWKRPQSYYRDVLWKTDQLSLFVKPPKPSFPPAADGQWSKWRWEDVVADWNWKGWEGKPFAVTVYSSCNEVELLINGKSLGRKATNRSTRFTATFEVPYQPGTLEAIGYDKGKQVNAAVLKTAQAAAQIRLKADTTAIRADGEDLSYVTVEVTDPHGIRVPDAENMLHFRLSGPGTIVGVGNANPRDTESYQSPMRRAWKGRCLVIIRSKRQPGRITLAVSSEGLAASDITIASR
jgi:beta-galactosidase